MAGPTSSNIFTSTKFSAERQYDAVVQIAIPFQFKSPAGLSSQQAAGTFPAITGDRCRTGPGGDVEPLRTRDGDRPSFCSSIMYRILPSCSTVCQGETPWGRTLRLHYFDEDSPPSG